MPLPPGSPSQFSVLLAFLVSGSLSNSWVMCPFLTPAMLRKFMNHVVEATCNIIRETVLLLHDGGFCNGDITKQCLHLSVDLLFQLKEMALATSLLYMYVHESKLKKDRSTFRCRN